MTVRKLLAWSCMIGVVLAALPVAQRVVVLPLYLEGHAQGPLSLLNRLSAMVLMPGKVVMYSVWPPSEHYFTTSQLLAGAAINLVLYSLCTLLALRFLEWLRAHLHRLLERKHRRGLETSPDAPASAARRTFLIRGAWGAAGAGVLAAGLAPVLLVPGWIRIRRITFPLQGLPPSLNGLTIAHLTDFHHDEWISIEHVRDVIRITNRLQPDIVALTGDYVTSQTKFIRPALREIARLRPRVGSVAVLGNHDWWADPAETQRRFKDAGIPSIDNSRMFVSADRRLVSEATGGLCLAGVGDLWEDEVDLEKALYKAPAAMPRILLSHNPDVAEDVRLGETGNRVDLMLSGHTHGGQVRLPYVGTPIVPSAYGSKYVHGLARGPHCAVHISAGIGMAMLPVRLGVPPEIVLITLTPG